MASGKKFVVLILISTLLMSCATEQATTVSSPVGVSPVAVKSAGDDSEQSGMISSPARPDTEIPLKEIYNGTGRFVGGGSGAKAADSEGEVTLNFQASPIAEVVKTILGDILNVNYAISAGVSGTVSMRTANPVGQDALIPVLDNLLRMNGAAIVKTQGFYEIVPIGEGALTGLTPSTRLSADRGYQVLIVPLRYIGAREMAKILEPVKSGKAMVQADEQRNLLTLAGTHGELFNLRETVSIFDVDQLAGKSVGLFRMQNVEAGTILGELETVFGDAADGPLAGMVKFTTIERLNALLVISTQAKYLTDVETWIKRLDQAQNPHGMNMYVYYVQNGKAENLAELLTQLFEGKRRSAGASSQAATASTKTSGEADMDAANRTSEKVSSIETGDVTILPDTESNSLLILATPTDYEEVIKAVEKLDVLPMQVLVEASIVEVTLGDDLEYGLQWFFTDQHSKFGSIGGLNIPANGNVIGESGFAELPGALPNPVDFTYAVFDAVGTRAVLNAVAGDSRLNVLSSPTLMVLDNQTAIIRVGDQVPIRTSETSNTSSAVVNDGFVGSNITSQIQYRDTGVSLEVTPRVNAGGMVMLEITQKVDDVKAAGEFSSIDSPTILQREITTSVAVQSGETIVLGGLIREDKEESDSGIPFLKDIPIAGALFGGKKISNSKTELVVLITPSAIGNPEDARRVTEEYKSKLKGVSF